jgi:hypothetical protein
LKQETAESETGMTEKSRWDQANIQQKPGLVWKNRKKISQITKDYFYLPFFLLIILCLPFSTCFFYLFYVPLPGNVGALYAEISCGSGEGYIELFSSLQHHRILYPAARH